LARQATRQTVGESSERRTKRLPLLRLDLRQLASFDFSNYVLAERYDLEHAETPGDRASIPTASRAVRETHTVKGRRSDARLNSPGFRISMPGKRLLPS